MPIANGTPAQHKRHPLDQRDAATPLLFPDHVTPEYDASEDALLLREAEFKRRGYRVRITNADGKQWFYPPQNRPGGTIEQAREWQERWDKVRYPTEQAFELVDPTLTPYTDLEAIVEGA